MGSSDLFPEKFAMYFGTMSPLASKIYADIEGIEDYIKSHGPPSITYSEKCSIVDKFLIYDHLHKNDANGKLNKRLSEFQRYQLNKSEMSLNCLLENNDVVISETELLQPVFYSDATLDQDHESVLLTSVAPKKPEKYVYDENSYWTDEHSVPYSSCTETQAKACKLHQFLNSLPPPPQQPQRRHDHPLKYRAPPIPTAASVRVVDDDDIDDDDEEEEDYIIRPTKTNNDQQDYADRYSKIDKLNSEKPAGTKYPVAVPMFGYGDGPAPQLKNSCSKSADVSNEQDLPNQVQNKDLIAELQAKLKKGKSHSGGGGKVETDTIGTDSVRTSIKLHKPKAPPPPPPGNIKPPGGAVKVKEEKKQKSEKKEKETTPKMPGREISDEFVVDVSSPCKTVTTKTGLDFLDNW